MILALRKLFKLDSPKKTVLSSGDTLYEVFLNLSFKGQGTFKTIGIPVIATSWEMAKYKARKIFEKDLVITASKKP